MPPTSMLYVGTYTLPGFDSPDTAEGIYRYKFDWSTGELEYVGVTTGIDNPSYLAPGAGGAYLYAVSELMQDSQVHAYSVEIGTGALTHLNQQSTHGAACCYVAVDPTGRYVLVSNYLDGSAAVFTVQPDGSLSPANNVVRHQGSGVVKGRQDGPHAHCIVPMGNHAYISDLGIDKIMIYNLADGKLTPNAIPFAPVDSGAGPRHLDFHPNERFVYSVHELNSTVTAFSYDSATGGLTPLQTLSTLPEGWTGTNYPADIHIAASGKFLYLSNRGHDSIAIYAVDNQTGLLTFLGTQALPGKWPRNFVIDFTGRWLLVAHQNSNSIAVFSIDPKTGLLTDTGKLTEVKAPVCLKLI